VKVRGIGKGSNDSAGPPPGQTAEKRDAVIREWLARTLAGYPEQAGRFLLEDKDPFRNPVGRALREGLPVLFDEVTGGFDKDRLAPVLDEIVHIRAVQDFSASEAVGFIFLLKEVIRDKLAPEPPAMAALDRRIDELALLGFDLYMKCRETTCEIRIREARRRVFVAERAASSRTRS